MDISNFDIISLVLLSATIGATTANVLLVKDKLVKACGLFSMALLFIGLIIKILMILGVVK